MLRRTDLVPIREEKVEWLAPLRNPKLESLESFYLKDSFWILLVLHESSAQLARLTSSVERSRARTRVLIGAMPIGALKSHTDLGADLLGFQNVLLPHANALISSSAILRPAAAPSSSVASATRLSISDAIANFEKLVYAM